MKVLTQKALAVQKLMYSSFEQSVQFLQNRHMSFMHFLFVHRSIFNYFRHFFFSVLSTLSRFHEVIGVLRCSFPLKPSTYYIDLIVFLELQQPFQRVCLFVRFDKSEIVVHCSIEDLNCEIVLILNETALKDKTSFGQMLYARLYSYCTHILCYFRVGLRYQVKHPKKTNVRHETIK